VSEDFTTQELAELAKILAKGDAPVEQGPTSINLDGSLEPETASDNADPLAGMVDIEWPVYGLSDVLDLLTTNPVPYPVDVYHEKDRKETGLAGVASPGDYRSLTPIPAPQQSQHWEDSCACFKPHTVVWNGVGAGGAQKQTDGTYKRVYDGSLMGEWPLNPPREGKVVNPEKARLAALEAK
jgi:hypothetical protein